MKKFEFKTTLTLEVPSIVVASNEKEARERLESVIEHAINSEIRAIYIKNKLEETALKGIENVPEHFTRDHQTLLEMGYPIRMIENYTQEDAEEEISAALSSL